MNKSERLEQLDAEIKSSARYRAKMQLDLLSANFYAFDINYSQWKKFMSALKQPDVSFKIWDQNNREEFDLSIKEATRLLLNFLASVTGLIAATRNTAPVWYRNTKFAEEYEARKNKLVDDEAHFIEDLRNYSQHYGLPFVSGQLTINIQEHKLDSYFLLDKMYCWIGRVGRKVRTFC